MNRILGDSQKNLLALEDKRGSIADYFHLEVLVMRAKISVSIVSLLAFGLVGCTIRVEGQARGGVVAQDVPLTSSEPIKTCPDLDPQTTVTYTFDALNEGRLEGQDGWMLVGGNSPMEIKGGKGFDGSKAAVFLSYGQLVRKNDTAFSIPKVTGTETTLAFEYDTIFAGIIEGATSELMLVSTATMTGKLEKTSTSPWIGLKSGRVNYREASMGQQIAAPLPADVTPGNWIRLRLVVDLTDTRDGKHGSATAFIKNLSRKDTVFRSIAGLQNLDAHLERLTTPPTSWDGLYIRFDKPADYRTDNLRVSPASNCK